jgi:alanine-synthesizing transaminase
MRRGDVDPVPGRHYDATVSRHYNRKVQREGAHLFARRTQWNLEVNRLGEVLERLRQEGREVLDLTESNPTRAGFTYPAAAICSALAAPEVLQYTPAACGLAPAREAVSRYYAKAGLSVPADHIVLTASTSEAYSFLFKLLADPDDAVLIPAPSYPLFDFLTVLESVQVVPYDLAWDGEWHVDIASVRAAVTPRTRAILVVNPNNPTGNFLKADELASLEAVCRQHDLALIADEVFSDYGYPDATAGLRSVLGTSQVLTFAMSGLSKLAGLPQLKAAWIAVGGPGQLVREALDRLEVIADTYLSVNTPVQVALPGLLSGMGEVQGQIRDRVLGNRAWLKECCGPGRPYTLLRAEAGWYAILEVPRTRSEEAWTLLLLEEEGVLVQPGYFFEMTKDGYLVLSLLPEPAVFQHGVSRVLSRLERGA